MSNQNELRGFVLNAIGNASLLLVIFYVLGYIYVKSYLAYFGFQVELASLSLTNLILSHRFFVRLDFFVACGFLQYYLIYKVGFRALVKKPLQAVFIGLFPLILNFVTYPLAEYSEPNVPIGYFAGASGAYAPSFGIAWVAGALSCAALMRIVAFRKLDLDYAVVVLGTLFVFAVLVSSYRDYALASACDRTKRGDFQDLILEKGEQVSQIGFERARLVYTDSSYFFLLDEPRRLVLRRDNLTSYEVTYSPPATVNEYQGGCSFFER